MVHPDLPKLPMAYKKKLGEREYQKETGDLVFITFYYLLSIGEYTTKTRRKNKTRKCQFWENDVTLSKLNPMGEIRALPRNVSKKEVMLEDAAMLKISKQKNGHEGACVQHMANM